MVKDGENYHNTDDKLKKKDACPNRHITPLNSG